MCGEPGADLGLDDVERADRFPVEDCGDRAAQPEPRELTASDERAGIGEPGVGEDVETFEEATLGMRIEIGNASVGRGAFAARLCLGDALTAFGSASTLGVLVDVTHDGGEVAIAGADMTAACTTADAALGHRQSDKSGVISGG